MRWYRLLAGVAAIVPAAQAIPLQWVEGFVENRGQWEVPVVYLYAKPGLTVGVLPTALVFDAYEQGVELLLNGRYGLPQKRIHRRGHVIWLQFEGAAPVLGYIGMREPTVLHFLKGNRPERWCSDVPLARMVELVELYPGITLRLWALSEGPRYDFVLRPGADLQQLRLRVVGAEGALVALQGTELRLFGAYGPALIHSSLRAYQEVGGQRVDIPAYFVVEPGAAGEYRLRFEVPGYDKRYPLIIDPIVYATCVGASADERAPSLQRLPDGNILTVLQSEELSFRMTPGAYDTTYNGLTDAVVLKLDPTLRWALFATYLGGSGSEFPVVVGVESGGEILVGGSTNSPDFPVRNPYQQVLQGGVDLFAVRLTVQGSQLRWATYVGGGSDDIATTGSVRRDGIIVLAGRTQSSNYPTTSGAYQRQYAGNFDVFVTAVSNTGASLSFSTYLGGSDNETAWAVYTDPEGYTYLCGETSSSNFPNYPVPSFGNPGNRPYDRDYNGGTRDAFVAKFRPTSAVLQYCTFLGGNQEDYATGIVARDNGEVWVVGVTRSANFPVTASPYQRQLAGGADGFVCRFTSQGLGTGSLLYSSFLGGSADDEPRIVLEFNNAPIVIGRTRSGNFPVTPDAHSQSLAGGEDIFITVFPDLLPYELAYSTYVGTLKDERPLAAFVDARGDFYIAGETNSAELCRREDSFQTALGGGWDAFLMKFVRATLTLFAPRGGERFCAGSAMTISWNSSDTNPGDTFRIELSSDRRQWTPLATTTGTTYMWAIPATQPAGRYWVRVVHLATGLSDSHDSAFVIASPPSITQQPPDTVRLCVGDTLVLQVAAVGDSLVYQWYRGDSPIPGAQQPVLRLPITGLGHAGQYSVRIRGSCPPELRSRFTAVLVEEAPRIVRSPEDVTATAGQRVCFSVSASGGTIRRYQWLRNGVPIPGAVDTSLCIAAVTAADTGLYQCVVWNRCGSDTSAAARLRFAVGVADEGAPAQLQLRWIPSVEAPQRLQILLPEPWQAQSVLYSVTGRRVAEGGVELSVEGLPSGVYWLVVEAAHSRWVKAVVLVR